ncbi:MAG: Fic family protein [Patescibacteria group bacterium]
MYIPKYTITTAILRQIGQVEAAREVIENAPLVPAWEAKFQDDARVRAVHFGTALEGNDLTFAQAKTILEGNSDEVVARERDIQEVINYRKVLDYIEKLADRKNEIVYTREILFDLHKLVIDKLIPDAQVGEFRESQVVLKNSVTGEVGFRPPSFLEVPFLIDDFLRWLNSEYGRREHPVIRAAITHYVLVAIHPFIEGNGRTARALATLVLFSEDYDIKRLFALEEYFDKHADEYFGALMQVSNQSTKLEDRDITPWLEVFTKALAIELSKIKDRVRELSIDIKIKEKHGKQIGLSERQMKLVEYLNAHGEIGMAAARSLLSMVSEDTILRDLKYLLENGVVEKKGSTKAARYILKK